MAEIVSINPFDEYIEAIVTGVAYRGFPYFEKRTVEVLAALKQYDCNKVLYNFAKVNYEMYSDILAEHKLAQLMTRPEYRVITWAFVLPSMTKSDKSHLENAAVNRSVRLRTFIDRDEAIHWLIHK